MICVGEGPSGGLAVLCGPWAALQYPEANVDVVTFDTPFVRFPRRHAPQRADSCEPWQHACACACAAAVGGGGGVRPSALPQHLLRLPCTLFVQVGFNPQFAWSFEQLVVLHYM